MSITTTIATTEPQQNNGSRMAETMTFSELKLCLAIHRAELGGGIRATGREQMEAALLVMLQYLACFDDSYFPYTLDDIDKWRLAIRKNKDTRIKMEVALCHGHRCFWEGRGKGPCCDDAECGHLVARCDGGELTVENCVIECRSHNNQRRERSIEQYLRAIARERLATTGGESDAQESA